MKRALFLDRDGTLIRHVPYIRRVEDVVLLDDAAEVLLELRRDGFALILVGNQSGVARGLISPSAAEAVHARFIELLNRRGVDLDGVYYCFHGPWEDCACRKPKPGMLLAAARRHGVDLNRSFLIGDNPTDIGAAKAAGVHAIHFAAPPRAPGADARLESWDAIGAYLRNPSADLASPAVK
jgi:D-glycero-D-manno-heptose 1,7-bisphosphate phosphatase